VRTLSADEAELWAKVAATIRPLSREPIDEPVAAPEVKAAAPVNPPRAAPRGRVPPARPAAAAPSPRPSLQAATLDGSWDKSLRAGNISPDRTLDLHGHHLDGAWSAIDYTLERAIAAGDRVVLLITGHERRGEPPIVRGRFALQSTTGSTSSRATHRKSRGGQKVYKLVV
jgi:DNA-nicking Smr family endonuclease